MISSLKYQSHLPWIFSLLFYTLNYLLYLYALRPLVILTATCFYQVLTFFLCILHILYILWTLCKKVGILLFIWVEFITTWLSLRLEVHIELRMSPISRCLQLSCLYSLLKPFLMVVYYGVYLFAEILLTTLLLKHKFFQSIRIILLCGVCNSHFKLLFFLSKFNMTDCGDYLLWLRMFW